MKYWVASNIVQIRRIYNVNAISRDKDRKLEVINLRWNLESFSRHDQHAAEISTPFIRCLPRIRLIEIRFSACRRATLSHKIAVGRQKFRHATRNVYPIMKSHRNEKRKKRPPVQIARSPFEREIRPICRFSSSCDACWEEKKNTDRYSTNETTTK